MISSMTGFGKSNGVFHSKKVSVEIRSLNSKGLDLNIKLNSSYKELETAIRGFVSTSLDRGKIDISVYIESQVDRPENLVNYALATTYYKALKKLNESWGEPSQNYLEIVMQMPSVLNQAAEELEEEEKTWLMNLVGDCCLKLQDFRQKEGEALQSEFKKLIAGIRTLLNEIGGFEADRLTAIRERMNKALKELDTASVDENRLEQEMIFYIEKLDVSEEKMRLEHHLDYFLATMETPLCGKKLGFIAQEIGREINTLGSKCNQAQMQKIVVEMKDSLEKIKEQVLNTL
ncbi:MAG: YicC family protein [Flavobacteriia bacterium]|nr:YicC family protein [Flavobacteriia bacterium]